MLKYLKQCDSHGLNVKSANKKLWAKRITMDELESFVPMETFHEFTFKNKKAKKKFK